MSKNKGFAPIILIIIAVLVLGGGYWVWQGSKILMTRDDSIQAKFIYPVGGERLRLGEKIMIKWKIPQEAYNLRLSLIPTDNPRKSDGSVHEKIYLPKGVTSYDWQTEVIYPASESEVVNPIKVSSGENIFRLDYQLPSDVQNGKYLSIETKTIEIVE